jgi:short subunit dehydrogenase-like uncharacterized protein
MSEPFLPTATQPAAPKVSAVAANPQTSPPGGGFGPAGPAAQTAKGEPLAAESRPSPDSARPRWMIYGATGYTGELIAREAVRRGLSPILAGRTAPAVEALGRELGLEARAFALDELRDAGRAAAALAGAAAVLHCAGPFVRTSAPMAAACLAHRVHYLDITGEIEVFEAVLAQGPAAREAGVVLLPGAGFDVVPSDCLACRLAGALPGATELDLAFVSTHPGMSRGTMKTMIESLPHAGAVRKGGRIVGVPIAYDVREIEFGCGRRWAMTIPWGDVSTAYHSTGIPNIRVYIGAGRGAVRRARRLVPLLPLAAWKPAKRLLQRAVNLRPSGPDEEARRTARVYLWGEVRDGAGHAATATLETPESYQLTAVAAVTAVERVVAGAVPAGSWTPGRAFGPHFVAELPGVVEGELRRSGGA